MFGKIVLVFGRRTACLELSIRRMELILNISKMISILSRKLHLVQELDDEERLFA